ncbi:YkgJ family cysteine cluster protein [Horticoccus sp. 23ND18S-11]|uniref:YkgJ family cysteine cluster protein n=1 Tax=Horticoccus sp. 23ND18S-11 TaxID=3391832 RepID=UPI0039C97473
MVNIPAATAPTDCRGCGVCCYSLAPDYVRVTGKDWARLGADAERVAQFLGHRAFMRMTDGHCAALDQRIAPDGSADFFCTIYERRPQTCRDLGRGTPACLGELAMKQDRVKARRTLF